MISDFLICTQYVERKEIKKLKKIKNKNKGTDQRQLDLLDKTQALNSGYHRSPCRALLPTAEICQW